MKSFEKIIKENPDLEQKIKSLEEFSFEDEFSKLLLLHIYLSVQTSPELFNNISVDKSLDKSIFEQLDENENVKRILKSDKHPHKNPLVLLCAFLTLNCCSRTNEMKNSILVLLKSGHTEGLSLLCRFIMEMWAITNYTEKQLIIFVRSKREKQDLDAFKKVVQKMAYGLKFTKKFSGGRPDPYFESPQILNLIDDLGERDIYELISQNCHPNMALFLHNIDSIAPKYKVPSFDMTEYYYSIYLPIELVILERSLHEIRKSLQNICLIYKHELGFDIGEI